jgi:hypothetical protein
MSSVKISSTTALSPPKRRRGRLGVISTASASLDAPTWWCADAGTDRVRGKPAFVYVWDAGRGAFAANDVVVLTKGGERIAEVTTSMTPDVVERFAVPAELAA